VRIGVPIVAAALIGSFSPAADAQTLTGPITSSTGYYTISWSLTCPSGNFFNLYENTSTVYSMGCATSMPFNAKPAGSYTYHIERCKWLFNELICTGGPYDTTYNPHTVTVVLNGSNNVSAEPPILSATQHGPVPYIADTSSQDLVTIEVPIETLPGVTRETTPRLSVAFNSRRAALEREHKWSTALLGYGWYIDGLSSIRRCEQRIASAPALNFTSTDRLCVDGELLVLAAGTYWAAGSEYRTERETFSKIVAQGSGTSQWFEVYTEDGRKLRYGPTTGSRIAVGGTTVLYEWALADVEDAWGNLLTISYHADSAIGEIYPLSMAYGGYTVQFEYALRTGPIPQLNFDAGRFARRTVYLHTIKTRANTTLSREYRLNSDLYGDVVILKELQSCGFDTGGNPQCMDKFTFNWFFYYAIRTVNSVTDNLGLQTSWVVSTSLQTPSSLAGFHGLPQSSCPTTTSLPPGSVDSYYVWSMSKSDGTNVRSWSFSGTGTLYSTENRGFLGIVETLRVDNQTGKHTYVGTHACFPYTGMTAAVYEFTAATNAGGQPLAKKEFFVAQAALGPAKFPYVQQHTALQFENGANFGADQINSQYTYSANLIASQILTRQVANSATLDTGTNLWNLNAVQKTTVTTTQFQNSTSPFWRVHFPSSTTTTHAATGEPAGFDQAETRTRYGNTLAPEYVTQHPATDTAHQVRFGYNANGSISWIERSGASFTTRTVNLTNYLDSRYPQSVTNAAGHTTTLTYDLRNGNPSSITDPNQVGTQLTYDSFGRLASIDFPDSRFTNIVYDNCPGCSAIEGQPVGYRVTADPASEPGGTTIFDRYGRPIRGASEMLNGQWSNTDVAYDGGGRILKRSSPYFAGGSVYWTNYSYDQLNRPTSETRPDGGATNITYSTDASYRIATLQEYVTNPAEYQYTYRYLNALGQLEINYDGTGAGQVRTDYDYQSNGWLDWTRVNMSSATVTQMTYDRAGNRLSITEPNTGTTSFDFDGLGQVLWQGDSAGRNTWFAYDSLGRLTQRNDNGVLSYLTYDSGYKALGRLSTQSTTNFSETYTYDSLSRLYTIATSINYDYGTANFQLTQAYDAYSRPTDTTFPSGFVRRTQYNGYGYVSAISNTAYQTLQSITAVDAFGHATGESFLNGRSQTTGFDPASGRVSTLAHTGLGPLGLDHTYTWRSNGILRQRTQGATSETFTYDQFNRLTIADASNGRTLDFGYDNLGNLLYKTSDVASDIDTNSPGNPMIYGTGGAGPHGVRTADIGGVAHTLGYDGAGNVTSDTAASGNATYAYNARNLVTAITKNGITETFKYDPDGQRFYKKSTSGDKHTFYLYGGLYQETRIGAAGTGYRKVQVSDTVQVTTTPGGSEETLYFRRDHLGSIDAILDGAGGIVDVLAHDPFGERRADTWASQIPSAALAEILANEDMRTKRGFTDHEQLDEVDIIHMNGRIYDPRLGRFLNADPIVQAPFYSQSYNRYAYTFNSPLSFVDPSGFEGNEFWNLPSSVERWANSGWEMLVSGTRENMEPGRGGAEFGGPLDPSGANTPVPTAQGPMAIDSPDGFLGQPQPSRSAIDNPGAGIPTIDYEREMLRGNDVIEYYESRLSRGDGYASLALQVVKNEGVLGKAANLWLFRNVVTTLSDADKRQLLSDGTYVDFVRQVNIGLANAHALAVDRDVIGTPGLLSAAQISQYHEEYFRSVGLPATTFGGSAFFGIRTTYWCGECDWDP
jgi:RHS repeat-associated protein